MRTRSRSLPPLATAAAALLLGAVVLRCVRRDELHCENAVARLRACCEGFDPGPGYCEYAEGCGVTYPTISEDDAACIVATSCGEIVAAGICDRAASATPPTDAAQGTDLCP